MNIVLSECLVRSLQIVGLDMDLKVMVNVLEAMVVECSVHSPAQQ